MTNLGQIAAAEEPRNGLWALLRHSRKLAELQRTAKAVNITSSRLTGQYKKAMGEVA